MTALGLSWSQCRRLVDLPGMLRGGGFDCSDATRVRALRDSQYVKAIESRSGDRNVKRLLLGAIDPGELLALAHLAEDRTMLFASGDLQWMRTIHKPRYREIRSMIAGRIICLETILFVLLEQYGPQRVIQRFGSSDLAHHTLKILFSRGVATSERDASEGITSYYKSRELEFGADFFHQREKPTQ